MAIDAKQLGNQPAAPFSAYEEEVKIRPTQHAGFTKREHFAGLVLANLANRDNYSQMDVDRGAPEGDARLQARHAIRYADALLAELAKGGAQ